MRGFIGALLLLVAGCQTTATSVCNGVICPAGTRCIGSLAQCFTEADIAACDGLADGTSCSSADFEGSCQAGVCFAPNCGDGIVSDFEACDGPTTQSCQELGFYDEGTADCNNFCRFDTSQCTGFCGDGVTNGPELCDGERPANFSCFGVGFGMGATNCSAQCGLSLENCRQLGFTSEPLPFDGTFYTVAVTDDGKVFAAGFGDRIAYFNGTQWGAFDLPGCAVDNVSSITNDLVIGFGCTGDGGAPEAAHLVGGAVSRLTLPDGADPYAAWGDSENNIYAVGPGVYHFDGSSWSELDTGIPGDLFAITGISATEIYVSGTNGFRRFDGTSWAPFTVPGANNVEHIWGDAADNIYALDGPTLHHFDGANWSSEFMGASDEVEDLYRIAGEYQGRIYLYGDEIMTRINGTWVYLYDPQVGPRAVGLNASGGMYVGANPGIFRYHGAGLAQLPDAPPITPGPEASMSFAATDLQNIVASAQGALATAHFDGGQWSTTTAPSSLAETLFDNEGGLWGVAGAGNSGLFQFSGSWSADLMPLDVKQVVYRSANEYYVLARDGFDSVIRRFNGSTFTTELTTEAALTDIVALDEQRILAVGRDSYLHDGTAWAQSPLPDLGFPIALEAATSLGDGNAVAVGINLALHYDGTSWTDYFLPVTGNSVGGSSSSQFVAGGLFGNIALFDGVSWNPVGVPGQVLAVQESYLLLESFSGFSNQRELFVLLLPVD